MAAEDDGCSDGEARGFGSGGVYFAEVAPGPFELAVTAPGMTCGMDPSDFGPSGSGLGTIAGVAVPGTLTDGLVIFCH